MKLLTILLFLFSHAFAGHFPFESIPYSMQGDVNLLLQFDETKKFLQSCECAPISLKWMKLKNDDRAFWSYEKRIIALNSSRKWQKGEILYSILFELQNAEASPYLVHLDELASKNLISKQTYVEEVEWVEFNNILRVNDLVTRGVCAGYFPKKTEIPDVSNFQEHFKIQVETGHAAFIAQKYDLLSRLKSLTYAHK